MKLLFDQNISFRILKQLTDTFKGSVSVYQLNLIDATDNYIWDYALKNNFTIVTFDADFADISNIRKPPPKVIWLRTGNLSTKNVIQLLDEHLLQIIDFVDLNSEGVLQISTN